MTETKKALDPNQKLPPNAKVYLGYGEPFAYIGPNSREPEDLFLRDDAGKWHCVEECDFYAVAVWRNYGAEFAITEDASGFLSVRFPDWAEGPEATLFPILWPNEREEGGVMDADIDEPHVPLFTATSPTGTLFFAEVHMNWIHPKEGDQYAHEVEAVISHRDYLAVWAFFKLGMPGTAMPGIVGYVVTEHTSDGDLPADCLGRKVDIYFHIPEEGMHLADAVFAEDAHATA